jgi:enoyl-CoA hydratase/carnithine racemase
MSIQITRNGDILVLALNRTAQGNRLDQTTVDSLIAQFSQVDPLAGGPAVVVLTALGPDFSLGRERPAELSGDPLDIVAEFERIQQLNEAVQRCRAITIASVQGRAEGAGLSLAGRCDIVVVADDAQLSFPEIAHGIPPTIVLSHYRYVLPHNLLGDIIYAGRVLRGEEAVQAGLVARVVPAAELDVAVDKLAHELAATDRRSVALVKTFLTRSENLPPAQAPSLGISLYANEMAHRLLPPRRAPGE